MSQARGPLRFAVVGVVHEHGPTLDRVSRDEPPVAGILGVRAVVAHHEEVVRRHDERSPVVAGRQVPRAARPPGQEAALPLEFRARRIREAGRRLYVRFLERKSVHEQLRPPHAEGISGHPDDPFHVIRPGRLLGGVRRLEHDHIAPGRSVEGGEFQIGAGDLGAVHHFVHKQEVADQERVLHRGGRNLEGLDDERADEEKQDEGDEDRLRPFPQPSADGGVPPPARANGRRPEPPDPPLGVISFSWSFFHHAPSLLHTTVTGPARPMMYGAASTGSHRSIVTNRHRSARAAAFRCSRRTRPSSPCRIRIPPTRLRGARCPCSSRPRTGDGPPRRSWARSHT